MNQQNSKINHQQSRISQLETNVSQQQSNNSFLLTQIETLKDNLSHQTLTILSLQSEVTLLKNNITEVRHTETGLLECGQSDDWERSGGHTVYNHQQYYARQKHVSANFQKAYTTPPIVFLSVSHIYGGPAKYGTQVQNVNTTGFSVRCGSAGYRIWDLEVRWLAVAV